MTDKVAGFRKFTIGGTPVLKNRYIVYLKFKYNCASCILRGKSSKREKKKGSTPLTFPAVYEKHSQARP